MKIRVGCLGTLFIISLILGTAIGIIIETGKNATPSSSVEPTPVPTVTPGPTPTILVIGINEFNSQEATLVSAWLVSQEYYQVNGKTNIHFTMKTLYPVAQSMLQTPSLTQYAQPHDALTFNPNDLDSVTSLVPLTAADISWDEIVVIDEFFMNCTINLSDSSNPKPMEPPPPSRFTKPWLDAQGAYQQQANILLNLCNHPEAYFDFLVANTLIRLYPDHIRSSISAENLLHMWQINVNLGNPDISCSFIPEQ